MLESKYADKSRKRAPNGENKKSLGNNCSRPQQRDSRSAQFDSRVSF